MIRKITLLLLCSFIVASGFSQILTGADAQRTFPGANQVRLDKQSQLPKHIELDPSVRMTIDQSIEYLTKNTALGPEYTFQFLRSSDDHLGMTHHRYQQMADGKPVIGGVYLFHTKNGMVQSMNGQLYKIKTNNAQASISKDFAIEKGIAPFPNAIYGWETTQGGGSRQALSEYPDPELVWVQKDFNFKSNDFRLAYKMDIYAIDHGHHHRSWVYVDAQTGDIVAEENRVCEIDVPSLANTIYSGTKTIFTEKGTDDQFRLRQSEYGNGIITLNLNYQEDPGNAFDFVHEDSIWGNDVGFENRYALDAHYGAEQYYLLLDSFFNRTVLQEGNDSLPLLLYVHFGNGVANAFWNGSASFYGDGDGSGNLSNPLTTVDVVAHEFTHGLTQFTAGLIYRYEPGALNESFSDIFGLATDLYARPDQFDWRIGNEATANNAGIRNAENPNEFNHPDTYFGDSWLYDNFDQGGVHINSGVQNHWFYLLTEGGSGTNDNGEAFEVQGIGYEKALAVAYRNLSTYLTPSSHFHDAAYYASLSALELYGACSQEYESTVNAWHAVGLGEAIGDEIVADFLSQRIFCTSPVDVAFINNSNNYESVSWDFGDGNMSTEFSPVHTYMMPGTYDVALTLTFCDGQTETVSKTSYIIIDDTNPTCSAVTLENVDTLLLTDCSATILDPGGLEFYDSDANSVVIVDPPINDPLIITFEECRLRGGDFVRVYDGNSLASPILAQYTNSIGQGQMIVTTGGAFTVHFTSNASDTLEGFIFSYSPAEEVLDAPVAGFSVSNNMVALNAPVLFNDSSVGAGRYFWDFGDGNTSDEINPVHQYTQSGTFTVTQTVINCEGESTLTSEITVGESGIALVNPDTICVTLNAGDQIDLSFDISNLGGGDLYYNLPDSPEDWLTMEAQTGELAASESVTIDVTLDADNLIANTYFLIFQMETGDSAQFNIGFPVKMIVLPFPQTNFNIESTDICNGTYQFNDLTLNAPTSWIWNFGDGNMSTESSPVYQYEEEGNYEVSLIACNDLGCDSLVQEELILVSYCDSLVFGETGFSSFDNCNGILYDQGGPDGNYSNNSDYIVSIAPTGAEFVTLTFESFQIQPNADLLIIYDGADTLAPILNSYSGSLPNGFMITATGNAITLRFITDGFAAFAGFEINWTCSGAMVPEEASFSLTQDDNCNNSITVEATPIGDFDYTWNFGDGNIITTNESVLNYNYQTSGTYDITLEVSNVIGATIATGEVTITEIPFTLEADISSDFVNVGETFSMEAVVDITPVSYLWIPQVGDTLTDAFENYSYDVPGDYIIYLEVTDAEGCKMFVETAMEVVDPTSATDLDIIEDFKIIPNPSNGQFALSLDFTETKNASILMFNSLGQIIHDERLGNIESVNKDLNFTNLPSGIYFLSVLTDQGTAAVRRLVIQK